MSYYFSKTVNDDFDTAIVKVGFAHDALKAEDKIGVMLPCNVIVQEHEDGKVEVSAVDSVASMMAIKNDSLGSVAMQVREKLSRVIENL